MRGGHPGAPQRVLLEILGRRVRLSGGPPTVRGYVDSFAWLWEGALLPSPCISKHLMLCRALIYDLEVGETVGVISKGAQFPNNAFRKPSDNCTP